MRSSSTKSPASQSRTVVFYDGGCSLCRKEIQHYARRDRTGRLRWEDINQEPALLNALGVTTEQAMRRLHVLDRNGLLRVGACAFATIWSELPVYRVLSKALYACGMIRLIEPVYECFAVWRYKRRFGSASCRASSQHERMQTGTVG